MLSTWKQNCVYMKPMNIEFAYLTSEVLFTRVLLTFPIPIGKVKKLHSYLYISWYDLKEYQVTK